MVSKHCHALSEQSTRAATVLGAWSTVTGLIEENSIIAALKSRRGRTQKTKIANVYIDDGEPVE